MESMREMFVAREEAQNYDEVAQSGGLSHDSRDFGERDRLSHHLMEQKVIIKNTLTGKKERLMANNPVSHTSEHYFPACYMIPEQ
jgi:hypothetical protein